MAAICHNNSVWVPKASDSKKTLSGRSVCKHQQNSDIIIKRALCVKFSLVCLEQSLTKQMAFFFFCRCLVVISLLICCKSFHLFSQGERGLDGPRGPRGQPGAGIKGDKVKMPSRKLGHKAGALLLRRPRAGSATSECIEPGCYIAGQGAQVMNQGWSPPGVGGEQLMSVGNAGWQRHSLSLTFRMCRSHLGAHFQSTSKSRDSRYVTRM